MINVFTDGGARGNPGPAGIGVYITKNNKELFSLGKEIGETTNNVAEYTAVVEALSYLVLVKEKIQNESVISFFLDSELVCRQINGIYKVKDSKLRELMFIVRQKEGELSIPVSYTHIPREKNKHADRLVNAALDKKI